jgi:hypothetical protein
MPRRSFADHSASWRKLYMALEEFLPTLPTLAPYREQLGEVVDEVYRRKSRLLVLQSQVAVEAELLRDTLERGKELESRLRSGLRSGLGPHATALERFGIKPVKRKRAVPAGGGAGPAPEESLEPSEPSGAEAASGSGPAEES